VNTNAASADATVTVVDDIAPTVHTQNITVHLDATGHASITAAQINDGSTDNCSIASYVLNKTSFDCSNVGGNTVSLTVTDVNTNPASADATVTVVDDAKPIITAPANKSVNNDADVCGANVAVGTATATDNCGVGTPMGTRSDALALNASYPVGTTTITWNVTDVHGNAAAPKTTIVTVTDHENPVIANCASDINLKACADNPTWSDPTVSDNCSASIVQTSTGFHSGDHIENGATKTIVYTATDASGNQASCSFTVTRDPALTASAAQLTGVLCNGESNGSAKVTAGGGSGGYTYLWDDGETSATATTLNAGSHSVTVTDSKGCTKSASVTITQPDILAAHGSNSNPIAYFGYTGDQTSIVAVAPTGGTAPYTISITINRPLVCNKINDAGDETWVGTGTNVLNDVNNHTTLINSNTTCLVYPTPATVAPPVSSATVGASGALQVKVALMADADFTVTITDKNGCDTTYTTHIDGEDVRCFAGNSGNQKYKICHQTGNPKQLCVAICIDPSAWPEHEAHGDFLGPCPTKGCSLQSSSSSSSSGISIATPIEKIPFNAKIANNPSFGGSEYALIIEGSSNEDVQIIVTNMYGVKVFSAKGTATQTYRFGSRFASGTYIVQVIQGKNVKTIKIIKGEG
jgi:hypothetical protein